MLSECPDCYRCPEPDCGRIFCRAWSGWEKADGDWVCDDHLEPTEPMEVCS